MPKEGGIFYYSQSQDFNPLPALTSPCKICSSISCNKWLCFTPTSTLLRHLQGHFSDPCFHALLVLSRFCLAWVVASRDKLDLGVLRRAIALVQRGFFLFFSFSTFLDCSTCQIFFSWMNLSMKAAVCFVCCSISCVSRMGLKLNSLLFSCALICFALYLPNPFHLQTCPSFLVFFCPTLSSSRSLSLALSRSRGQSPVKGEQEGGAAAGLFLGQVPIPNKRHKKQKKRKKSVIDPNDRGKSGVFKELICSN